jgi:hypothetical protein
MGCEFAIGSGRIIYRELVCKYDLARSERFATLRAATHTMASATTRKR